MPAKKSSSNQKWSGVLQCDGYAAYDAFARRQDGAITLASCIAHIRRGFYEAREQATVRTGWLPRQIRHLYVLEKVLRKSKAGPALRHARRVDEAAPTMKRIKKDLVIFKGSGRHLPQSAFGKALSQALGQWDALTPSHRRPGQG